MPDDAVLDGLVSHTLQDLIDNTVTKLGYYALYENNFLVNVSLPSLTSCGSNALYKCTVLANAAFSALETMGSYMFWGCTNLVNVSLPSLKNTASNGFQGCTNLEEISLPSAVTTLQSYLFSGCSKLERITATGLTNIGGSVFENCVGLTSLSFPNVTDVGSYAFRGCTNLASISLPVATNVQSYAFENCSALGVVALPNCTSIGTNLGNGDGPSGFDFTNKLTIPANAFYGSGNMQHLILRSDELCPLSNVNAFNGTPISVGCGLIYVPADLVDTYKAATNWSTYASQIVSISEYPKTVTGSIEDDWATILANTNYATDYAIGDTKILDIDGSPVLMQIVAFDADTLASGGGTAGITWISKGFVEKRQMNSTSTTTGGYANMPLRTYVEDTLYNKIDATVRAEIKEVSKTYRVKNPSDTTATLNCKTWIPSAREVGFTNTSNGMESSGPAYTSVFTDNNARKKGLGTFGLGTADNWWLRSMDNGSYFSSVYQGGYESSGYPTNQSGVVLGFCTN